MRVSKLIKGRRRTDVAGRIETATSQRKIPAGLARRPLRSPVAVSVVFTLAAFAALSTLGGWMWSRSHSAHEASQQRARFLQIARQEALNLTTIDWQHAEPDVQRILDAATGRFRNDFADRAQPFVDAVKQAKSKSVGTIGSAGIEAATLDEARVLVAVAVTTTTDGQPSGDPHAWRMRLSVQRVGEDVKVSNVEFVS